MLNVRYDAWRGNIPRENRIKAAIYPLLASDVERTEYVFNIIKAQPEY